MKNAVQLRLITQENFNAWSVWDSFLNQKAPNSRRLYEASIRLWVEYIGSDSQEDMIAVTHQHVFGFIAWLRERKAQPGRSASISPTISADTILLRVKTVQIFYRQIVSVKLMTSNPVDYPLSLISRKRETRRPHNIIPFEKVNRLFDLCGDDIKGLRDRSFLSLLFGGGLRISEALNLRLCDVHQHDNGVQVMLRKTKNGENKLHPIGYNADFVVRMARFRFKSGANDDAPLLCSFSEINTTGEVKKWDIKSAYRAFKTLCHKAGLTGVSPHSARATVITKLLEDGVPHREIMEFSRHASIQMVEHYDKTRAGLAQKVASKIKF